VPLTVGTSFHNTSLYELLWLLVLFAGLGFMVLRARRRGREVKAGTLVGVFLAFYGVARFLTDTLRVNDERTLRMTGAQWMCLVMVPAGVWILWRVRPKVAALAEAELEAEAAEPAETESESTEDEAQDAEPESKGDEDEAKGDEEDESADEPEPAKAEETEESDETDESEKPKTAPQA
jgi:hypothetical protein